MIETIEILQNGYLASKPVQVRKEMGQYFTGRAVADYMASMISPVNNNTTIRILDAGAGAGILTIYAAMRCLRLGNDQIHAVLYEIDSDALSQLNQNMEELARSIGNLGANLPMTYNRNLRLISLYSNTQSTSLSLTHHPSNQLNGK